MKIHILNTPEISRPEKQNNIYPAHNHDYGVEQDFYRYLHSHPGIISPNQEKSDWHYLPIFWTRWHVNHDYAQKGKKELQKIVDASLINPKKTFSICQYDDGAVINISEVTMLLSSRKSMQGIDIPLLSKPHLLPLLKPKKKYLASFMGRLSTHKDRLLMASKLIDEPEVKVFDGNFGTQQYLKTILSSSISLCPRGYGGSSFRFFESMQLGVVPFLIGEIDSRPFKNEINWDEISLYSNSMNQLIPMIKKYSIKQLREMGTKAHKVWKDKLNYQKWCLHAINELENYEI